jgi:predicted O-methyltransferase YrrM
MQKTNIIEICNRLKFDYMTYKDEICRIGDLTAIRFIKGKKYRRNYERSILIMSLIKAFNVKSFFEFGTGRGFVTAAASIMNVPVIYTVDSESTKTAINLLTKLGIKTDSIVFINKKSDQIIIDNFPKFDLVFIDGGHDYKSVKNDYEIACKICDRGLIVFDDFRNKHKGVKKFIKTIPENKILVNTDGWIFENSLISIAGDADKIVDKKETDSGQVIKPKGVEI